MLPDCALCGCPYHEDRCRTVVGAAEYIFGYLPMFCDCPGYEEPEDAT
ncbi:hypothetical protein SEA_TAPIOCA_60 [Mycobacterium phage Tapioca]|uniref:Uncharacterized protein n=17 Tax=Caudoviricetes TaxID=2731619 RepID=G1FTZ7_9CAUD|nr:hypothetical protein CL81_gp59 [Mycobacterium phage Charlie]YP_009197187.1 hypothetical protein AVV74_gp62 [Mycobacterium phage Carcharodon]YP_009595750.1 hypothetical protein FDG99_gp59 [Mycobacterium phage SkinnyPete]YP_009616916.1 hypothetical protein FDI84_gp63 [Mycobacterium phage Pipsqueaks]YP_009964866.1 hypothetical protein I5J46_gp64 [Mycobacterium phage FirstPlacePfu]YP_010051926.1 hypothetical protein KD928_gp62 [Mycobacterium phage Philonius]YP_010051994.1 hypothetical protein 